MPKVICLSNYDQELEIQYLDFRSMAFSVSTTLFCEEKERTCITELTYLPTFMSLQYSHDWSLLFSLRHRMTNGGVEIVASPSKVFKNLNPAQTRMRFTFDEIYWTIQLVLYSSQPYISAAEEAILSQSHYLWGVCVYVCVHV